MQKLFLDRAKPLHICKEKSCSGCQVASKLNCHFSLKQLAGFFVLNLPLFLCAGYSIYRQNLLLFVLWAVFTCLFFTLIEIRVMCSHCPHYAEPTLKSLKCWANYGAPKIWKYRPNPMSATEKIVFFAGFIIILLPPVLILVLQKSYLFAAIYLAMLIVWKIFLKIFFCKRCFNFACPFNVIERSERKEFLAKIKSPKIEEGEQN